MTPFFIALTAVGGSGLAGCGKPAPAPAEQPRAVPATASPAPAEQPRAAPAARAVSVEDNSDILAFAFAWPAEATAIPALDRRFRADLAKARAEALANAREDARMAKADGREFHGHDFSRSWTAAGQSPRLLSLEGATGFFTGGAHPNHGVDSLLWDRDAGREIGVADLFAPPTRFAELVSVAYCRDLDAERAKRREGETIEGQLAQCPGLSELAIVPTDADRNGRFETIRFIAAPYVAGPYAEGEYDIALPVTAALLAGMKPDFRASFEVRRADQPQ